MEQKECIYFVDNVNGGWWMEEGFRHWEEKKGERGERKTENQIFSSFLA